MADLIGRAAELRLQAGVSQAAMARHLDIAQPVLASWETGRIKAPGTSRPDAARKWIATLRFLDATMPLG
jgi:DNA-binding transcriptional regulator YiaG